MAYKVIILYQLYMPSYFLGTFTEYPYLYHQHLEHYLYLNMYYIYHSSASFLRFFACEINQFTIFVLSGTGKRIK